MSEQASTVAREAKGIHQSLKEALKTREAWDREVDFQRKTLRRHYLRLLLVHPYTKESKDAENHLWMQTSYTFISIYKQRVAALDPTYATSRNQPKQPRQGNHGPVEYRKLLQRFQKFLAEEERFWSQLVVRLRRSFDLDEAQPALVSLGIVPASNQMEGNSTAQDGAEDQGASASNGRNHFQFPPYDSAVSLSPKTPAERESRLAILSKALVCLGDIARYRELYHEGGGRPKAGHEENIPLKKPIRNKRGGEVIPRARNYDKAQQCYEQARLLVPYEGNPSHQLAILASYKKDIFGSLLHYYRALCVRQPYDTASENLNTVLTKTLGQRSARLRREMGASSDTGAAPLAPVLRVEAFKMKLVVLHALWRLGIEKMDSIFPNHAEGVRDDFLSLVSERCLPPDLIPKVVILSQGALWKHRMIRDPPVTHRDDDSPAPSASDAAIIESRIVTHVLALHESLLQVGIAQLAEAPPEESDLAQRITATFRRTLPALRIASKWLMANVNYVFQYYDSETTHTNEKSSPRKRKDSHSADLTAGISQFWRTYSQFSTDLRNMFPLERLPRLNTLLEEDVDMKGFLPLRNMMGELNGVGRKTDRSTDVGDTNLTGQVHPNEEQLMRIADLLNDARTLMESAELENLSIIFSRNQFMSEISKAPATLFADDDQPVFRPSKSPATGGERVGVIGWREPVEDDAKTETDARTDDDPVGDAFRQVLEAEPEDDDEQEEDEIVWNPRPSLSPVSPPLLPSSPLRATLSPIKPLLSPIGTGPRSPTVQSPFLSPVAVSSPTTAEDLLNNVMGIPRTSGGSGETHRSQLHTEPSATRPQLLFGSGPSGPSIWSTSFDDRPFNLAGPGQSYNSAQQYFSASSPLDAPSKWYPNLSQSSQNSISTFQSTSSASHAAIGTHHHQRSSSSSVSVAHLGSGQSQNPYDPYRYPPVVTQQQLAQPLHARQFQLPPDAYSESVMNSSHGAGMHYGGHTGGGGIRDYHGNYLDHNQTPAGVGQTLAPPPLWGNAG